MKTRLRREDRAEMCQVLLPVDRNAERAFHRAKYVERLGNEGGVEATVVYVFPHQDCEGAPPHTFEEVEAAVEAADALAEEGASVERVGVGGEVARTLLEAAEERDVDDVARAG